MQSPGKQSHASIKHKHDLFNLINPYSSNISVLKVGIDLRRELLRNLIVVGGITRMPGFLSRLKSELLRLIATGYTSPRLAPSIDDIRFHQFPRQIAGELFCAWLGGEYLFEIIFYELVCQKHRFSFSHLKFKFNIHKRVHKI